MSNETAVPLHSTSEIDEGNAQEINLEQKARGSWLDLYGSDAPIRATSCVTWAPNRANQSINRDLTRAISALVRVMAEMQLEGRPGVLVATIDEDYDISLNVHVLSNATPRDDDPLVFWHLTLADIFHTLTDNELRDLIDIGLMDEQLVDHIERLALGAASKIEETFDFMAWEEANPGSEEEN